MPVIATFAIAVAATGPAGLAVRHLGQGELLEAIWLGQSGLCLRAERGSTLVKISPNAMRKYWKDASSLQVLETQQGMPDQCWLVPLTVGQRL